MLLQSLRGLAAIARNPCRGSYCSGNWGLDISKHTPPGHPQLDSSDFRFTCGSFGGQQLRSATKKAGGSASQKQDSHAKNLGVKMLGGELIFPGQIIVRQRGLKYHPGYSVGVGRDHTIFATGAGFVHFHKETVALGRDGQIPKQRMYVSVKPVDGVWDSQHRAEVESQMVARRAAVKREILRGKPFEPALFFSRTAAPGQSFSWLSRPPVRPLPPPAPAAAPAKGAAKLPAAPNAPKQASTVAP